MRRRRPGESQAERGCGRGYPPGAPPLVCTPRGTGQHLGPSPRARTYVRARNLPLPNPIARGTRLRDPVALGARAKELLPKIRDWMSTNAWIVKEIVLAFFVAALVISDLT
jgi:hypothetical protein